MSCILLAFAVVRVDFLFDNTISLNSNVSSVKLLLLKHTKLFLCGQIVAGGMKARGSGGSIVNVSSQASQCALRDHTVYCE